MGLRTAAGVTAPVLRCKALCARPMREVASAHLPSPKTRRWPHVARCEETPAPGAQSGKIYHAVISKGQSSRAPPQSSEAVAVGRGGGAE